MPEKYPALLAACAVTFVLVAAAVPATAKDRAIVITAIEKGVPVRRVSHRDLNLATLQDKQILVDRVRYAAKDVCRDSLQSNPVFETMVQTCRARALQGAESQIDRAVKRATDIATNGWSAIAPVAITISVR